MLAAFTTHQDFRRKSERQGNQEYITMIRLTYISSARPGIDDAAADAILARSRINNARTGLTGLLLYDGVRFLQALEGEEAALTATVTRIKADPRHRAFVELSRIPIETRAFGKWDMAWRRVSDLGEGATLTETVARLVAQVPDASTRALFAGFSQIRRSAA
jgi:hypothetical protein